MRRFYQGDALAVHLCDGAVESWEEVDRFVDTEKQDKGQLARRLKQLADKSYLREPDQINNEGQGIYAVKANKLRAYGWFSADRKHYYISHITKKSGQKLKKSDLNRALRNRNVGEIKNGLS